MTISNLEKKFTHLGIDKTLSIKPTSKFIDSEVCNKSGDVLGNIKEFMVDIISGNIMYGIISYGGFLGVGGNLVAIPWDALRIDKISERVVLDIDLDRFKLGPSFNSDSWPNMNEAKWASKVDKYYAVNDGSSSS